MRRRQNLNWRKLPAEDRVDAIDDDLYELEHSFVRIEEKIDNLTTEVDEAVQTLRRTLIGAMSAVVVGAVMFGIGLIQTVAGG